MMAAVKRVHRRSFNEPGHAHELTFSCFDRYKLLGAERSRAWLKESLDAARATCEFDLWAYVIMPEHVHLIVHPRHRVYDIAAILRAVKEPVAREAMRYLRKHRPDWLPKLTRRYGQREKSHFWMLGGGYDRNVEEPKTLVSMIEYIHLNPVRRGLVERAVDWPWSSAAEIEGVGSSPVSLDRIPAEWLDVQT